LIRLSPELCPRTRERRCSLEKKVVAFYSSAAVEYWVTATDYVGVYPMHCHNVVHEDGGMMVIFRVDDIGDTIAEP